MTVGELVCELIARLRGSPTVTTLRRRGMRAGENVHIGPFCIIDHSHAHLVELGDGAILAPHVHLLAHDASTKPHLGYTRIAPVRVGRHAFVGAGSIVLPGVTIGDGAIIGAGSLVARDVPAGMLAVGHPARIVGSLDDYLAKRRTEMAGVPVLDHTWTVTGGLTAGRRDELARRVVEAGSAYVP
jgi:maltose O-acetyltransferase